LRRFKNFQVFSKNKKGWARGEGGTEKGEGPSWWSSLKPFLEWWGEVGMGRVARSREAIP